MGYRTVAAVPEDDRSGEKRLHAESAAAGFFEFGCVYDDRGQALLAENCVQVSSPAGRDVPSIGYDSVADELVSLLGCQLLDSLPVFSHHLHCARTARHWRVEDAL